LKPGASLKEQLHILGETVAKEAQARRSQAAAATAFQLYALTHKSMQSHLTKQNAATYRRMAKELLKVFISERAAHVSREVCPHTGCDDYRLALHLFSNAGTDYGRHFYHRIRSSGLKAQRCGTRLARPAVFG
jgi:hypothetical protein